MYGCTIGGLSNYQYLTDHQLFYKRGWLHDYEIVSLSRRGKNKVYSICALNCVITLDLFDYILGISILKNTFFHVTEKSIDICSTLCMYIWSVCCDLKGFLYLEWE